MAKFSSGKNTFRCCDRCGFRYPFNAVKRDGNTPQSQLMVCESCYDQLNPYLVIGQAKWDDPQAVRSPRPDVPQPYTPQPGYPPPLFPPAE